MENAVGIGTVTPELVEARARELAAINGHGPEPSETDYQQAKRELTGGPEMDLQEETLESMPESERWQAAESQGEDEDAEGRSESAQLFEEGVNEAEHNQMLQAAQEEENDETEA